jgi:hypothetical protein
VQADALKAGDAEVITENARKFVAIVREARAQAGKSQTSVK